MKKYQIVGIIAMSIFSFYYTDKIASMTLENNEIYQSIKEVSKDYEVKAVDALIENNYIIPGLEGQKVNVKTSFYNMRDLNTFNEYYLVFDKTYPSVSINNNKDKIIKEGNKEKRNVAIVIEYDESLINLLKDYGIDASILVNMDNYKKEETLEQINNDYENYHSLDTLLNKYNNNPDICFIDNLDSELCQDKYKVTTELVVTKDTFIDIKNNIEPGDIYYIKKLSSNNMKILINSIIYKDLDIVRLSKLISEER